MQRVLDHAGNDIVRINDATRNAVRDALQTANQEGWNLYQIAHGVPDANFRGLDSIVQQLYKGRSEVIARTEVGRASQEAARAQWSELGVGYQEIQDGEDFDDFCASRNGEVVTIDEAVDLAHPQCTVVCFPVVTENAQVPAVVAGGAEGETGIPEHQIAESDVKDWLKGSVNDRVTYHLTNEEGAKQILEQGVDVTRGQGALGQGFYTARGSARGAGAAEDTAKVKVAIRMDNPLILDKAHPDDMALFRSFTRAQGEGWDSADVRARVLAAGYDGIMTPAPKAGDFWVVAMKEGSVRVVVP